MKKAKVRKKRKSRRRAQEFLSDKLRPKLEFGGVLLKNSHAKEKRPISTKQAMHLVLRSSVAKGSLSFRSSRLRRPVEKLVRSYCDRFGISLYEFANVGNHLHLLVRVKNRFTFPSFIKALTGVIARLVLGAQRGSPKGIRFWDYRPYSRIVAWKRGYQIAKDYVIQNRLEALGVIPYTPRAARRGG